MSLETVLFIVSELIWIALGVYLLFRAIQLLRKANSFLDRLIREAEKDFPDE